MFDSVINFAKENGIEILKNQPLSKHTTMKVGGPARFFACVDSGKLVNLLQVLQKEKLPFFIIGRGSNLLFSDAGFDGFVIKISADEPVFCQNNVTVSAGTHLSALSLACKEKGFTGLEFAHGIPGSVGGGIYMNAGAFEGSISDCLVETRFIDTAHLAKGEQVLSVQDHKFAYRHSIFMENPTYIILSATFELKAGVKSEIEAAMESFAALRREKQPLEYPSSGSSFKRPPGHFAGRLIEDCGLKGFQIGGAQVSDKHAGFIINRGNATCADIVALFEHIEGTVFDKYGVKLEREVRIIQ